MSNTRHSSMSIHLGALVILLRLLFILDSSSGDCIWFDKCGYDPDYGNDGIHELNCQYSGPAVKPSTSVKALLLQACPHLDTMADEDGICCSKAQIVDMIENYKLPAALLSRCPACLHNFQRNFCDLTCHSNQSSMLKVTKTIKAPSFNGSEVKMIKRLEFKVSEKYVTSIYDSCAGVLNPSTSGSVMDFLCGSWTSSLCTPKRWFEYLGSVDNGHAPFQIDYVIEKDKGYDVWLPSCHHKNEYIQACSCTDCEASCPAPNFDKFDGLHSYKDLNKSEDLFSYLLNVAIMLSVLIAEFLIFFGALWWKTRKEIPENENQEAAKKSKQMILISKFMGWIGRFFSRYKIPVIVLNALIFTSLSAGMYFLRITSDPVELWSAKNSRSRIEKDFYDRNFEPFYRTAHVIISPSLKHYNESSFDYLNLLGENSTFSNIFESDFLLDVLRLQKEIENIKTNEGIRLMDVCYKPLAPEIPYCLTQSIWSYWQNSIDNFNRTGWGKGNHVDTYLDHLTMCIKNPFTEKTPTAMQQSCLSNGFIPVKPEFILGGYVDPKSKKKALPSEMLRDSKALILTFLIQNHLDSSKLQDTYLWERAFINHMTNLNKSFPLLDVAFMTDISVQDAIESESSGDILAVVFSYIVMLIYISLALSDNEDVESGILVSLVGIFTVLLSILSTIGFFGYVGVTATLITFQIIPFLVLAVGVDNIFLIVTTVRKKDHKDKSIEDVLSETVEEVGPPMLLSTTTQAVAFYLGTLSKMPAVKTFALYAGTSLVVNFLAQMTGFVSVMALDLKHVRSGRRGIFCRLRKNEDKEDVGRGNGVVDNFFRNYLTPALFKKEWVKYIIITIFFILIAASLGFIPRMSIGLDPESTMPKGSYVIKFFDELKTYFSVGPPVYFVVKSSSSLNMESEKGQNRLCGSAGCNSDSLQSILKTWSAHSDLTTLATPGQSWIDDYFSWSRDCCLIDDVYRQPCTKKDEDDDDAKNYSYDYYTSDEDSIFSKREANLPCSFCSKDGRLKGNNFSRLLPTFFAQNPDKTCPKGGKIYSSSVKIAENGTVIASSFMAFHTILRSSKDFVRALSSARILADYLSETLDTPVFPYSIFYIFYEQYLTMTEDTLMSLGITLAAILIFTYVFSGNLISSLIITLFVTSVVINVVGVCVLLSISLNAILAINLLVAAGISVEFCVQYIYTVMIEGQSSEEAFLTTGSTSLLGIHITNLLGVAILGFAKSKIFYIYFFQVYLAIVIIGIVHGLIFLPVLMSFFY